MGILDWIIGVPMFLVILYFLVIGILMTITELIPFVWQSFRYERKMLCPVCHQRYVGQVARPANDQMYGNGQIVQYVCPNGHVGMQHGNRRYADWADF